MTKPKLFDGAIGADRILQDGPFKLILLSLERRITSIEVISWWAWYGGAWLYQPAPQAIQWFSYWFHLSDTETLGGCFLGGHPYRFIQVLISQGTVILALF
jgi:hypothetical protein